MERALESQRHREPSVRVQAHGWTAQCPRCERQDFRPAAGGLLACVGCGAPSRRGALLEQIARLAHLGGEVFAERVAQLARQTN